MIFNFVFHWCCFVYLNFFLCCSLILRGRLGSNHDSWIYHYLCNQCPSPLTLWVWTCSRRDVLDTTLCDKVRQWLTTVQGFSSGTAVSSTNKTNHHDIAEILLKMASNTINLILIFYVSHDCDHYNCPLHGKWDWTLT